MSPINNISSTPKSIRNSNPKPKFKTPETPSKIIKKRHSIPRFKISNQTSSLPQLDNRIPLISVTPPKVNQRIELLENRFTPLTNPRFIKSPSQEPSKIISNSHMINIPSTPSKSFLSRSLSTPSKLNNWSPSPKKNRSFYIHNGLSDKIQSSITNIEHLYHIRKDLKLGFKKRELSTNSYTIKSIDRWNRFTCLLMLEKEDKEDELEEQLTEQTQTEEKSKQILLIDPEKENILNIKIGDSISLGNKFTNFSNTIVYFYSGVILSKKSTI